MGSGTAEWLASVRDQFRDADDLREPLLRTGRDAVNGVWQTVTSRYPLGTNVFDREWDALVILDACRVDALRAVVDEYPRFGGKVDSIYSVGTGTVAWTAKTCTVDHRDSIAETAYVSANVYTRSVLSEGMRPPSDPAPLCFPRWETLAADDFDYVEYAFESGWDDRLDVTPPDYVTDRAIEINRARDPDRLVVHYTQPHVPYVAGPLREDREPSPFERDPWPHVLRGDRSWAATRELYRDNLRAVLDSVTTFLENFEGSVVITADHGELFGEWGAYSHPEGVPHPNLIRVPWLRVEATDTGSHDPAADRNRDVDVSTAEQLAALGYK